MRTVFETLLAAARGTIADPVPASGRGHKEPASPSATESPAATENDLRAALELAARERQAALATIDGAAERREALLLVLGSDDEIAHIGEEVDAANLLLERIERLVPELEFKLSALQDARRVARWAALRDGYIAAGRAHAAAMRSVVFDIDGYHRAFNAITTEFRDVERYISIPPFPVTVHEEAAALDAALDLFARIAFNPRPPPAPPLARSMSDLLAGTPAERELAERIFGSSPFAGPGNVKVRLRRPREINGEWHAIDAELFLPGSRAEELVRLGAAQLVEDDTGAN